MKHFIVIDSDAIFELNNGVNIVIPSIYLGQNFNASNINEFDIFKIIIGAFGDDDFLSYIENKTGNSMLTNKELAKLCACFSGSINGKIKTENKSDAARKNGKKGGRKRKR